MQISRFILIVLLAIAIVAAISSYPLLTFAEKPLTFWFFVAAVGLCGFSSILSYIITYNGLEKRIQLFLSYIVGGMMAKLFTGIITITVVAVNFKEYAMLYVLSYFGSYLFFTGFEVFSLMRKLRPHLKKVSGESHDKTEYK